MSNNSPERIPVIAYEDGVTILYPSIASAGKAYNLSTSQVVRLIENEQNIAHTRTYLDYALEGQDVDCIKILVGEPSLSANSTKENETERTR
jgi:hypothetical protein